MASRWKNWTSVRASTWRQALLFNALLLLMAVLAANTIVAAYTTSAITNPNSIEARAETRSEIDRAFTQLRAPDGLARRDWALRIDQAVTNRDFAAARGYLLAAPQMLNDADANAVQAAAAAEESGTQDQRILRAALLFLPDPVRANYQRAISPPERLASEIELEGDDESNGRLLNRPIPDLGAALPRDNPFSILGDEEDLVRRSQSWLRGEGGVDDIQLRLRALGLLARAEEENGTSVFEEGVTVLVTAKRAGRLNPRFEDYLARRIEEALPRDLLRTQLTAAFEPVMTSNQRAEQILSYYDAAVETEALERLSRDMTTVALLAELTSTQGAIALVEQTRSPEDMRRALLVTRAGGDRAVALSKELGPNILDLAQIGVKWDTRLILQIMALAAIGLAILMCMLSVLTKASSLKRYGR
ncbi:MAG: hypothetical protein AAGK66_05260 [Pseudomonadota bacterium]